MDSDLTALLDAVFRREIQPRKFPQDYNPESEGNAFPTEVRGRSIITVGYTSEGFFTLGSFDREKVPYSALFFVDNLGVTPDQVRTSNPPHYTNAILTRFCDEVRRYRQAKSAAH